MVSDELTWEQRRVFALMLLGHTDRSIARQMGISLRTVTRHVARYAVPRGIVTRFQLGAHLVANQVIRTDHITEKSEVI